jgi:bifunctional non-homologous end joining protein LigD
MTYFEQPYYMTLDKYWEKRDFGRTPEPRGKEVHAGKKLSYFIQKHAARHLHYDFRLELDGTLKSWAIPKGPSLDPGDKRLAVHVEDHPLAYGTFEGEIPAHQYGAGSVLVWDKGIWIPDGDPLAGYRKGRLKFRLEGEKLSGGWSLVRMGPPKEEKENWLLIKEHDSESKTGSAANITALQPDSVLSGAGKNPGRTTRKLAIDGNESDTVKTPRKRSGAVHDRIDGPDKADQGNRKQPASVSKTGSAADAKNVSVAGVSLSHPSQVLYPEIGLTKLQLAQYYERIADWMLPHLSQRPLTLVRCPHGVGQHCFFQKHANKTTARDIPRIEVPSRAGTATYMMVDSLHALISLVQMGVLELHTWGARKGHLDKPDRMIFDLDPAPGVLWMQVIEAAQLIRALLDEAGLTSFVKTTGGKGLHVVIPLKPEKSWDDIKALSRAIAEYMEQTLPDRFTSKMAKSKRTGKIFIDYLRNAPEATAVAAYSTRARPGAPVSTPVAWDELTEQLHSDTFTAVNIPARLDQLKQDPWQQYFLLNQRVTAKTMRTFGLRQDKT